MSSLIEKLMAHKILNGTLDPMSAAKITAEHSAGPIYRKVMKVRRIMKQLQELA